MSEATENKVSPAIGPSKADTSTWWFRLEHPDGRTARFRVEDRGWVSNFDGTGFPSYCFTRRQRGGAKPGVKASTPAKWESMCDVMVAEMTSHLQQGFQPMAMAIRLYHDDGRRVEYTIEENPQTIDFREDSYILKTAHGKGSNLQRESWPVNWSTLPTIRLRIAELTQELGALGFKQLSPGVTSPSAPAPVPNPEPQFDAGDKLELWNVYHFQGGGSDKVYSVELWKTTTASKNGTIYKVTARHGRRNGTLKPLHKTTGYYSAARAVFNDNCEERIAKGYKRVDAGAVNVSWPQGQVPTVPSLPVSPPTALGQNKPEELTPPGVMFFCQKCAKQITPRFRFPRPVDMTVAFEFGCHGNAAARIFTTANLEMLAARVGKFTDMTVSIYDHEGAVAKGSEGRGPDPATALAGPLPHIPFPSPPVVGKMSAKPKKGTVNDAPPPKPGTMIPAAPSIHTFGLRKVRVRAAVEGEDE